MRNLISAGLSRMFKDRLLTALAAATAAMIIVVCIDQYRWMLQANAQVNFDKLFFSCSLYVSVAMAIFASLFLGAEYADGTIRNKLVAGHSRTAVYLSNFAVCAIAGLLLEAVYAVVLAALGIPLFGFFQNSFSVLWPLVLDTILQALVFAAFYTALAMTVTSRSANAVTCLVLVAAGILLSSIMFSRLEEPELVQDYYVYTSDGMEIGPDMPNPLYLQPRARAAVELMLDILPSGHGFQLCQLGVFHLRRMLLCSAAEILLLNLGGLAVFRKKDLK